MLTQVHLTTSGNWKQFLGLSTPAIWPFEPWFGHLMVLIKLFLDNALACFTLYLSESKEKPQAKELIWGGSPKLKLIWRKSR